MKLTFNAIDVETANADRSSICQIGIVQVRDGVIADHWHSLINPNTWFDGLNIMIHGIDEDDVRNSPSFSDIREELERRLSESILVSHTSFDRVALDRASKNHGLEPLLVTWLDSARIVRRAWPKKYGKTGWGLENVAANLDIDFYHHDALEDAKTAAEIVLRACAATNTEITDWLHLVNQPIFPSSPSSPSSPEANPNGMLYGETVLFTGELSADRRKASKIAAQVGCRVTDNASKKVTILVVGTQDESKLRGYEKSTKHRKIEELINSGSNIEILSESDFFALAGVDSAEIAIRRNA